MFACACVCVVNNKGVMFREFFCGQCRTALVAWLGLLVVLGYSAFLAHIKARLNSFYATFYDLLQEGGGLLGGSNFTSGLDASSDLITFWRPL